MPNVSDAAGWSFVVIAVDVRGPLCLDCDYGIVGVGWCSIVMFSRCRNKDCCLCFDALAAGFAASGDFGLNENDVASKIARTETFLLLLDFSGHLGNELADGVAKLAAKTGKGPYSGRRPGYVAIGSPAPIDYLWAFFRSLNH